jgi:hypothetical protein
MERGIRAFPPFPAQNAGKDGAPTPYCPHSITHKEFSCRVNRAYRHGAHAPVGENTRPSQGKLIGTVTKMQVPFDFAQGRLSTAPLAMKLREAPLRMTNLIFICHLHGSYLPMQPSTIIWPECSGMEFCRGACPTSWCAFGRRRRRRHKLAATTIRPRRGGGKLPRGTLGDACGVFGHGEGEDARRRSILRFPGTQEAVVRIFQNKLQPLRSGRCAKVGRSPSDRIAQYLKRLKRHAKLAFDNRSARIWLEASTKSPF